MEQGKTLKVLGLDPSLTNLGIAKATLNLATMQFVVDDLVLVSTEPEKDKKLRKQVRKNSEDMERAKILHAGLHKHAEGAWIAFAEVPVGSQSARAMASYGMCVMLLASAPLPLVQVTPSEVKLAGAGTKTATKEEMIEWAMGEHPSAPWLMTKRAGVMVPVAKNEHLADAVGAIKAGIETDQFQQLISIMRGQLSAFAIAG